MTGLETIPEAEIQRFRTDTEGLIAKATAIEVRDQESHDAAIGYVVESNAKIKGIEALYKRYLDPLNDVLKKMRGDRDALTAYPAQVQALVDPKIKAWRLAERQRQEAEQRRVEEIARKEAVKEQERLAKIAEREAAKMEKRGEQSAAEDARKRAEEIRQEPVVPPPVTVQSRIPAGSQAAKAVVRWKFEVTDKAALPEKFKVADETAIRKVVQALKGEHGISGIRVWSEEDLSYGSRA